MNTVSKLNCVTLLAAATVALSGCDKKEEKQQAAAPVAVRAVDPMEGIELHAKVQWPDKYRPASAAQAQAIASLLNALASGDAEKAKAVLEAADREVLADMIAFGEWTGETGGLEAVRVCVLKESDDKTALTLGIGVQDSLGAYILAWKAAPGADPMTFSGMAIQPVTAASVAMLDDAELVPPVIASAAVETKLTSTANPADVASSSSSSGGGGPGESAPPRRPFEKPSGE